ncbi:MAG: ATP-binding protein [Prolixibacteraceae bacterium]
MHLKISKYSYLIAAVSFFIVAAIVENNLLKKHPEKHLVEDFQQKLNENEQQLNNYLDQMVEIVSTASELNGDLFRYLVENEFSLKETGMAFLVYESGELAYWSDRSVSFFDQNNFQLQQEGLIHLPNGFYLVKKRLLGDYHIYGLHLIKHKYRYENKFLDNTFFNHYNLPEEYRIRESVNENAVPVYNVENKYLFSVQPVGSYLCTTNQLYIPGIIYFLGLILLLYYLRREFTASNRAFFLRLFGLGIALFLVYWLHLIFQVPKVFYHLQFFSPDYFALSSWLPSLGDFFIFGLFFLFWMYNFGNDINISRLAKNSLLPEKLILILLLLFSAAIYLLVNYYTEQLVYNSTIAFSLNKIIEVTPQTGIGIFSVGLFLLGNLYFTVKIIDESRNDFNLTELFFIALGIVLFLAIVQLISLGTVDYIALAFFMAASLLALLFSKNYLQRYTLSYLIIFVSLASLYSLLVIYQTTSEKEREHQKLLAVTLVAERDPTVEVYLSNIQEQMSADSVIPNLLMREIYPDTIYTTMPQQKEGLEEYIQTTYFTGYFRKYEVRVWPCSGNDSLFIEMEGRWRDCFSFFEDMIDIQGMHIPGTSFYFMDNMNGRISYTGRLHYPHVLNSQGASVYIELNSDLFFEGLGFPELLIDKSMAKPENYKKFDYAKYYGGELTDKHGDYNYNLYIDSYLTSEKEFEYKIWDGKEHLIYHTKENNYVIVSREIFNLVDYLISFPYLFVFYFLSVLFFLFTGNKPIRKRPVTFDLKFRIQAAIISIVFISLLMVASATIWYNVREYKAKHQNDLNEKMKSIAEEIDMRLHVVSEITSERREWLHRELMKLSNIFRTDINIYGTDGDLIASSRSEIFDRGLVSTRMNAEAYYEIFTNYQLSYFQPENIGKLSYLSAYRPIVNNRGNYLGVINLPYFIKQDKYSQELSTIVVAFINLYVLLLLASIFAAVFIANQITRPLVVIQENLRKIELGKRNEPIRYGRNDEIGSLVKEYNKKVDELAVSAELLARSERESAWREMAKQIAHEIKNPLTPMKLNIQQLQRAKRSGKENEKFLERVTSTLIEQIDNLSNIATEFSNFAKIPTARNQVFNLSDQLQKVIDLFETHSRVHIEFHSNGLEYIEVNADREQLSRAIINLVKNGIQAVPEDHKGKILIDLNRRDHMALIAVSDNGEGIPAELRDKLFSPSFTTKSSGMGLGLAIVKNIVANFSGTIWFETEMGKGTTFYIEIPIYEEKNEK